MTGSTGKNDDTRPAGPKSGAAKVARLRDRIDRGGTGDKVAFKDPAAAPLGTDDEAAGTTPTPAQASMATEAEAGRAPEADRKPGPEDLQPGRSRLTLPLVAAVCVGLVILVVAAFTA